jgi:hypothetical protein
VPALTSATIGSWMRGSFARMLVVSVELIQLVIAVQK